MGNLASGTQEAESGCKAMAVVKVKALPQQSHKLFPGNTLSSPSLAILSQARQNVQCFQRPEHLLRAAHQSPHVQTATHSGRVETCSLAVGNLRGFRLRTYAIQWLGLCLAKPSCTQYMTLPTGTWEVIPQNGMQATSIPGRVTYDYDTISGRLWPSRFSLCPGPRDLMPQPELADVS